MGKFQKYKGEKMNIEKLNQAIDEALKALENLKDVVNEEQLNEMAPFITSMPFAQFRQEVLRLYNKKKERQDFKNEHPKENEKANELFPKEPYETKCWAYESPFVLVTNFCIEHVAKEHGNITTEIWQEFLALCNPNIDFKWKSKYNGNFGERWIYKCKNNKHCFGYVLDIFEVSKPQVVTVFFNNEKKVDNWIQNEINRNPKANEKDNL